VSGTKLRLVLAGLLVLILALSLPGQAMAQPHDNGQAYAPDRILVKFLPGTLDAVKAGIHSRQGGRVAGVIPDIGVQVVEVPANQVMAKVKAYRGESRVLYAEPDYIAEAILTPNDIYFSNQWGMTKIQAPQAWDTTTGSPAVKIAILDTGIDQNHEDLAAKIVANQNCTTSATVDDLFGHGTHVAGIAAAITNNGKGVAGVGFNSSLMNVKVLDDRGSGYYSWIAAGITWAADNGAKVINMSLGGSSDQQTLRDAVDYAWGRGVVIVAAAGNNGNTAPVFPGYYTNVIAVAATDQNDVKASFSNYSSNDDNWVDVAAPGVGIYSTLPNHFNRIGFWARNYGSLDGTSMASPFVAGLAGLVWATGYGMSNTAVRSRIESTADAIAGTGTYWQYGRINAYKAVAGATDTPPTVSITSPANGSLVSGTINITASASDDKGVSKVDFYVDTTLLATDSVAPYQYSWNTATVADGSHAIKAVATDTASQTAQDTVTVTVDNVDSPPTVSITSPANSSLVSGTINITASASDDKGVSKVAFYVDSALLATDSVAPYQYSWNTATVADGSHAIKAIATDTASQTAQDTVTVTVDNTQPVVTVVEPAEGATISGTITIKAGVTETNIDNVKYQIDGGSLVSMTYSAPYWQASWDSASVGNGAHTVTVRATDKAGNPGSDTNSFTVSNQGPPVQTMHVTSLQMSLVQLLGGRITYARATAIVVDAAGNPVQGATVSGHWEVGGTTYTPTSGTTGTSGQVTYQSKVELNPPSGITFTFVIDDVSKSGWTYDSSANGDFNGDGTVGDTRNSIAIT
jgi:thermitase